MRSPLTSLWRGCAVALVACCTFPALAQTVSTVTLTPSTVAGGSGAASTGIVTLSAAAPAGGLLVNLASNLPGLASTLPQVRVAAGSTSASFEVATNPLYRRFSGAAFAATISAVNPLSGAARSAVLNVTAQARPTLAVRNPIPSVYSGLLCAGEPGLLYDCRLAPDGSCSFVSECALGCENRPASGGRYQDRCAVSGPYPVLLPTTRVIGGAAGSATAQLATAATAGSTALLTSSLISAPVIRTAQPITSGATRQTYPLRTAKVDRIRFASVDAVITTQQAAAGGGVAYPSRQGRAWLAVVPGTAPAVGIASNVLDTPVLRGGEIGTGQACVDQLAPAAAVGNIALAIVSANTAVATANAGSLAEGSDCLSYFVQTAPVATTSTVGIEARLGSQVRSAPLQVQAAAVASEAQSLFLEPNIVTGGTSSTGTVVINGAAPSGGFQVTLSSDNPAAASVPTSVLVPAGSDRVSFPIGTASVTIDTSVSIRPYPSPVTASNTLFIKPGAAAGPALTGLSLSPASVAGGSASTATLVLDPPAPAGGAQVTLASNSTAARVPATVSVAAGANLVNFTMTTVAVSSSTLATVTATLGSSTQSAGLTINPASAALPAPSLLSPASGSRFTAPATISFDWNDVAGSASYTLELDDASGFAAPLILSRSVNVSAASVSGLSARTYYWRVRAVGSNGTVGTWSAVRSVQVR